jgi:hypothetical protein
MKINFVIVQKNVISYLIKKCVYIKQIVSFMYFLHLKKEIIIFEFFK